MPWEANYSSPNFHLSVQDHEFLVTQARIPVNSLQIDRTSIKCVVFDFGFTLCSDPYFKIAPAEYPSLRGVIQEHVFQEPSIVKPWMEEKLAIKDIDRVVLNHIPMDVPSIISLMEKDCLDLQFNQAVRDLAVAQKTAHRKIAQVTDNMDIFSSMVVPCHQLGYLFDVIVNSFDYGEINKEKLWSIAFERLGNGIGYPNSFLIIDGGNNTPVMFRALGGLPFPYSTDEIFLS